MKCKFGVQMISFNTNNNNVDKNIILSIETTVGGGSLSILKNQIEIDGWIGNREISKAEEVLEQILILLKRKNNISKDNIGKIVVSKSAGSLTGEKIGLALAKGLAKSLKCQLIEISVFESLLREQILNVRAEGNYLTGIPLGKNQIQWQSFLVGSKVTAEYNAPQISTCMELVEKISKFNYAKGIFAGGISKSCEQVIKQINKSQIIITQKKLSCINGLLIAPLL